MAYSAQGSRRKRVFGLVVVVGEADAAGVEEERRTEAANLLPVGVSAAHDRWGIWPEQPLVLLFGRLRQEDVVEGGGGAVEAEQVALSRERDDHGWREGGDEGAVGLGELRERPLAHGFLLCGDRLAPGVDCR